MAQNDIFWQRANNMYQEMSAKLNELKKSLDIYAERNGQQDDEALAEAKANIKTCHQEKYGYSIYLTDIFAK